jgi:hypothetical protein
MKPKEFSEIDISDYYGKPESPALYGKPKSPFWQGELPKEEFFETELACVMACIRDQLTSIAKSLEVLRWQTRISK